MDAIAGRWQNHFADNGLIRCWIIVPKAVVEALEATEALTCPINLADDDPQFVAAYDWLRDVMNQSSFPQPDAGITPWWCWVQRDYEQCMPYADDLDAMPPESCVLEMQIPQSELLLSCFDQWHMVLNFAYIQNSPEDNADFDAQVQAQGATLFQSPCPESLQVRLEQSWLQIFELDKLFGELDVNIDKRSVQGCFWTLHKHYITRIVQAGELRRAP